MYKKLLFLLLIPVLGMSQVQIGQDIDGENVGDVSYAVSLSSDGNIVAIGAPQNNNGTGHVRVYENISGVWTQIGENIDGESPGDLSGLKISLSSDGSIVAIGAPFNSGNLHNSGHVRVYENISGVWTQIGDDIEGKSSSDMSGFSVSLSSDGDIVAIGAPQSPKYMNYSGYVRVYENISGVWTQKGDDIEGEDVGDLCGTSVSLSSDGSIVAIGAPQNSKYMTSSGYVRVYENISGVWTQIGNDINGETAGDRSGQSVSLSSDGNIVAIGAVTNDGNGTESGHVRVYENISGVWTQVGKDIDGKNAGDLTGESVSLSSDGNIVVTGAPGNGVGTNLGHARIYKNISGNWIQAGDDIDGEAAGDANGTSISLSSDGSMVAIGAPYNDGNGINSGRVRMYDISNLSSNIFVLENFNIYPNPTSEVLNIKLENNLTLEKATIYNNLGQIVKTAQQNTVDVSALSKGIYFVEVTTNQGKAVKKVIVK